MIKFITRYFDKAERARRKTERKRRALCDELEGLWAMRSHCVAREEKIRRKLDRLSMHELNRSIPERVARGW